MSFCATWGNFINELSISGVIAVLAFLIDGVSPIHGTPVIERDPSISYALTRPETVPLGALIGISVILPAAIVTVGCILLHVAGCLGWTKQKRTLWAAVTHYGWCLLGLAQALLATKLVTDVIKLATSQPRPNFFALCDYLGYREAAATGNFTAYWAATTPGVFGSAANCQAVAFDVKQAQMSFPSGHSSNSWAGLFFACLFLRALAGVPSRSFFSWASFVTAAPLVLAGYVSISRVRDRWHTTTDVSVGAMIGIATAMWGWRQYAAAQPIRSDFEVIRSEAAGKLGSAAAPAAPGTEAVTSPLATPLAGREGASVYGAAPQLVASP